MARRSCASAAVIATMVACFPLAAEAQGSPKITQPDDTEWKPLSPKQTVGGPMMRVLWGDPLKREGGFLLKLPGDGELPPRVQAAPYTVVVVAGNWMHSVRDDEYTQVEPGGFYTQPAKQRHRDKCVAGPDCVVLIRTTGRFDLKPVKQDETGEVKPQAPAKRPQ